MKYIEYKENRQHGTKDFPFAFYYVTENHPRYYMPYHWHAEYEIIHVLSGVFHLTVNNHEYTLSPGDSAFIESGALHGGTPEYCSYACIVCNLDDFLSSVSWANNLYQSLSTQVLHFQTYLSVDYTPVATCIDKLCNAFSSREAGYRFTVVGSLYELLGLLLAKQLYEEKSSLSHMQEKKIAQLKSVLSLITHHYGDDLTLSDMADCAGMNPNYFCRAFREIMHSTPMDYLNYYRIESACEQLATTDKSITEIALDCGFHDASYFVKVFKKYKGVIPSAYLLNS